VSKYEIKVRMNGSDAHYAEIIDDDDDDGDNNNNIFVYKRDLYV
jgi:hypothetical protein